MQTQGKVDTKKLKNQLSLAHYEQILKAIGIPIFSQSPKEWRMWTGEKNKDPYSGSLKLYFYPESRVFMSYTSGCSMDIIELVKRRLTLTTGRQISFIEAVNEILSITGLDPNAVSRINDKKNVYDWEGDLGKFLRFKRTGTELQEYDKSILAQLTKSYPLQWLEEGISVETMEKYQIGYYERDCSTTIPNYDTNGRLVGIRVREWNPDRIDNFGKYHPLMLLDNTCYKFSSNSLWYGLNYNQCEIERTGAVMIGESEKFVMHLDSIYKEKNVAVGMFGNTMSTQKRNQLIKLGVNQVIYVPDCDFIGKDEQAYNEWEKKTIAFGKQWEGYAKVDVVWDDGSILGAKDNATDKGDDVWFELLDKRESLI